MPEVSPPGAGDCTAAGVQAAPAVAVCATPAWACSSWPPTRQSDVEVQATPLTSRSGMRTPVPGRTCAAAGIELSRPIVTATTPATTTDRCRGRFLNVHIDRTFGALP